MLYSQGFDGLRKDYCFSTFEKELLYITVSLRDLFVIDLPMKVI